MAKADLGTKRTCPNCASKFYDLGRMPAQCPKCGHEYDPTELEQQIPPVKKVAEDTEDKKEEACSEADGFEDEADDAVEVDLAAAEPADQDDDENEDASGLSDDIGDDFESDDIEDSDEDDNTTVLIDEEEDDDLGEFNIDGEEDL